MTRGPAATARELAARLLVDFDAAMEIERSTQDDSVFTSAIASWYEDEFAYLTENQALFASNDGFASIGHPLLVIEDSLSAGDPVVLRLAVRQLADVRDLLAAVH